MDLEQQRYRLWYTASEEYPTFDLELFDLGAANILTNILLKELLEVFHASDIPTLLLKGAIFSRNLYQPKEFRPMSDVDLLVKPGDVSRAMQALRSRGYPIVTEHPFEIADLLTFTAEFGVSHPQRPGQAEIHWRWMNRWWLHAVTNIDYEEIWRQAQPISIDGLPASQMSPEHTLLHSCVHMVYHHHLAGSKWYRDIDLLVQRTKIDWELFVRQAVAYKIKTAVHEVLWYTQALLHTPIPAEVMRQLRPAAWRSALVRRIAPVESIRRGRYIPGFLTSLLVEAILLDSLRSSLAVLFTFPFPPWDFMKAKYSLRHRASLAFYYPVHWLRLRQFLKPGGEEC